MSRPDGRGLFPWVRAAIREMITGTDDYSVPEDEGDAIPEDEQEALRKMARNPDRAAFLSEVEAAYAENCEDTEAWRDVLVELKAAAKAYEWLTCPICDGRVTDGNGPGIVHCTYCKGEGSVTRARATTYQECF